MNEAAMHTHNSFVTLTYSGEPEPGLNYHHFQEFMWRLRSHDRRQAKKLGIEPQKLRFFMCGEYGEQNKRPHFHALLFGRAFHDGTPIGKDLERSAELDKLWGKGFASVGKVTHESAAYVAGYVTKKYPADVADRIYSRVDLRTGEIIRVPNEFGHMSLGRKAGEGIGGTWYQKYIREVSYARDKVIRPGGKGQKVPRYYDAILKRIDEQQYERNKIRRLEEGKKHAKDSTPARLQVREELEKEKHKRKVRHL